MANLHRALLIACGLALATKPVDAAPRACATLEKQAAQLTGPAFLASFPKEKTGPLAQVAFVYDNAVAAIALVACGDVAHAKNITGAILAAQEYDRYWHDGRLRNGYLAGATTDTPLKLPGWWDDKQNMWVEDQYQMGSDSGNLAWAMLALLSIYRADGGPQYLEGAKRIGAYLENFRDAQDPSGFRGGVFGDEPNPVAYGWKSTEHNVDLAAAFAQLAQASNDPHWRQDADAASAFVADKWRDDCTCFDVGTAEDGKTANHFLALDAQLWPLLALPDGAKTYAAAISTANKRLKDRDGFAYSEAKEGVWTEGTAQAALLMNLMGRTKSARALLAAAARNRASDGSYYAARVQKLPTGFMLETDPSKPRLYFHIPHLAALGWVALAEQGVNPFTGTSALP